MGKQFVLSLLGAAVWLCLTPNMSLACRRMLMQQPGTSTVTRTQLLQPVPGQSNPKPSTSKPNPNPASWQGIYRFSESRHDHSTAMHRNYTIRISLARCGWRAFLSVHGHLIALDLQTKMVPLDAQTIGLYYQQNYIPVFRRTPFKPGDLLLKIQRQPSKTSGELADKSSQKSSAPTYRVDFETLKPLIQQQQTNGLTIAPPKPLNAILPVK
ncbi:hypothetical protein IQ266_25280 [filamentous cyanobacterium LEGE 11480]|uniref:Uncharacterized protein n=1 Tax=Romeriopsis navalis LEGE 11480 TaxID=2777977 RepID=A0A928VVZ0_9CYAN|nr:DUF5991 domain-containing protein [Romeriopsis navalis]MBE9033054.1 hypothetical protein [Romeriopsis navalis LEGE 11480]